MKVTYISPFPPTRHGIGSYTRYLCRAMARTEGGVDISVVADSRSEERVAPQLRVAPCFKLAETLRGAERADYVACILPAVAKLEPDVVHIQHGFSIFAPGLDFLTLIEELRRCRRVVVTLHAVFSDATSQRAGLPRGMNDYNHTICQLADAVVVHQHSMKAELVSQGADALRVHVIPHGTEILPHVDQSEARRLLGLPEEGHMVVSFGFFGDRKNNELLIEALPHVLEHVPDCYLFLAGWVRDWIAEDRERRADYEARARALGVDDRVIFADEFIPDGRVNLVFAAADIAAYPHSQDYLSASGSIHLALGALKPVVVSRTHKFEEVWTEISDNVAFTDNRAWELADVLVRLLLDDAFRDRIIDRIKAYTLRTCWDAVARRHALLYRSLCAG